MRVPGTFYVNDALAPLLFDELRQAVARKEVCVCVFVCVYLCVCVCPCVLVSQTVHGEQR